MNIISMQTGFVEIEGRIIPRLTAIRVGDGSIGLVVDGRFGATFPNEGIADQAAWLIAQALAVGAGYSSLGAETKDRPFAPRSMKIDAKPNLSVVPSDDSATD